MLMVIAPLGYGKVVTNTNSENNQIIVFKLFHELLFFIYFEKSTTSTLAIVFVNIYL